jgi:hypothetical protein
MKVGRRHFVQAAAAAMVMPSTAAAAPLVRFAAIGDLPYSDFGESTLKLVLEDIAASECQFTIHVGDLKSSGEPCSDELLARRLGLLQASPVPVFFTPGDNEWVDCARDSKDRSYEPEDRLKRLRTLFATDNQSLGQSKLVLERQSASLADGLPENSRWLAGTCAFATINLAGSFNGVGQNDVNQQLRIKRDAASSQWLTGFPAWASKHKAQQLVVAWHANPDFNAWPDNDSIRKVKRLAFTHAKAALQNIVNQWPGPVMIIHGDSHRFRIDRPWPTIAPNLQRLEVFGSPFVSSWARVTVASDASQFSIEPLNIGRR